MKSYAPRRRRGKSLEVHKQALRDLEHRMSREVSTLILLWEEGNAHAIETAKLKAKSQYLKHGNEMQKVAQTLGERYSRAVRDFLDSVDTILHSDSTWIDEAKVRRCYQMTQQLEKEISAA
ncbi:MAG: hypothetical protein HYZ48_00455 [Chlamydiales bacterium]|nr:hypothetical protein [Chlamydiales bacterium]